MVEKKNIDLSKIKNQIVRRALQLRRRDFMFYRDHEEIYNDDYAKNHSEHKYHSDQNLYGDYNERSGHNDCSTQRRKINERHMDSTKHWDEYSDS